MAKCEFCGKDVSFGIQVSHSHRRSNRTWKPNIKRVKAIVNGSPRRVYAWHALPAFRQGDARGLIPLTIKKARSGQKKEGCWPSFLF